MPASAVALALFAVAHTPLNTDLGWILAFGRDAVRDGVLPRTNTYSFLDPQHPVVMHEWLACIGAFLLHRAGGAAALVTAKWVLAASTVLLVWLAVRHQTTSLLATLLILLLSAHTLRASLLLVRPQLFSWLMLAFVVLAVTTGRKALLRASVPAFALWANLHGGFFAGYLVLGLGCAGLLVERLLGGPASEVSTPELLLLPGLAVAATLLNPYGAGLLVHTFHHATDPVRLLNQEWTSLWPPTADTAAPLAIFAVVVAVAGWLLPWREVRTWGLLLMAVGLGVAAHRHLRMAPILLAPVAARLAALLLERYPTLAASLTRVERLVPLVAGGGLVTFGLPFLLSVGETSRFVDYLGPNPGKALWVLRANGLSGRVWNDFNWGGHLLWVVPDSRVAVDGRNVAAYSAAVLERTIRFEANTRDPAAEIAATGADFVLLPTTSGSLRRLAPTYRPLLCADDACLLTSNVALLGRPASSWRLPPPEWTVSDFFQEPEPVARPPAVPGN